MSLDAVRSQLAAIAPDLVIVEHPVPTATVAQAAEAHGVAPGQIAKTLSLRVGPRAFLVVVRGDARLDNRKAKAAFGGKTSMLEADEALRRTGHPVGGVCPFGLATPLAVYCDMTLRSFTEVIPAAGSTNSSLRIAPGRLAELTGAAWVDVCQDAS